MFVIIGFVVVLAMVFGGFIWAGGKFDIILKALPAEMVMILGGSIGGLVMSTDGRGLGNIGKALGSVFKGPHWKPDDYKDLLCLMFLLVKTIRSKGVVAVEAHIENPEESKIFGHFPNILADHHVLDFICDYIRMMTMNFEDPMQMEDAMNADIERHHKEEHLTHHMLSEMAQGLPAVGIVAAVLGIVKTMSKINAPVEVLGSMIGGALVGTFLGIFLSYLFMGPIAQRFDAILQEDAQFYEIIKLIVVANLNGNAPQISVEIGRRNCPSHCMPSFLELEEAIAELPPDL
ncbi:flagellar motor stator protein MotA [Temperatibacter marinus]|uniref:Flagellar motor stator protein MotA n=1 Tax=Temperatibacter marinus TaxID=1456591 RepID=A0AA52EHK5_9PROT|nr:flagellar motor stator protein MotA [Temperatibacter marinus]WND02201.1 flagellar motor stator protein MotA [Temperatibacter marinus]